MEKTYTLLGPGGSYQSRFKGTLGGHRGLRIFGQLNCTSALRFIAKGQYVKHRVFFKDMAHAILSGYRPCAKCSPVWYKMWKDEPSKWNELVERAKGTKAEPKALAKAATASASMTVSKPTVSARTVRPRRVQPPRTQTI